MNDSGGVLPVLWVGLESDNVVVGCCVLIWISFVFIVLYYDGSHYLYKFLLLYYNSQCLQAEAHPSLAHSNPNPKTNHI